MPTRLSKSENPGRPRVAVLGATLGTGNLGVDALGMSMVQGIVSAVPDVEVVYQTWDLRIPARIPVGDRVVECEPLAIRRRGSLRNRDSLTQMQRSARLRRWLSQRSMPQLPNFSRALSQLLSCDVVFDVSAGDSFANIYGDQVFWYQSQIKLLCLELGLPLVLMPQTYGPFSSEQSAELAGQIVSRSTLVCSREAEGLAEIRSLCGDRTPPKMARVPDMAFMLEPRPMELPAGLEAALSEETPRIALNVSGLLYFAKRSFGLQCNYAELSSALLKWALQIPASRVLLVPHVVAPTLHPSAKTPRVSSPDTTDTKACEHLYDSLREEDRGRVDVLRAPSDPAEAKYAMSRCDFFVGARMHAFIGASSQCVPGALLAYSKKAEGLASLMDFGDAVIDLRCTSIEECVAEVAAQYERRDATHAHLSERIPRAQTELRRFFTDEVAPLITGRAPENSDSPLPYDTKDLDKAEVLS